MIAQSRICQFMKITKVTAESPPHAGRTIAILLLIVLNTIGNGTQIASAETLKLRELGRTLVEAEDLSAASENFPYAEFSEICSGQSNLGYYWVNSWFELELTVPHMRNFSLSLRASSPTGTEIEVQMITAAGSAVPLATVVVPKTGSWTRYEDTEEVSISLPGGVQTLRFSNQVDGANIDYLTFSVGSEDDIVTTRPAVNAGPSINPLKGFNSGWWRPDDDYASVGFQYISWDKFEPEDDDFRKDYVESVLDRAGSKDRHFILQFVVDWAGKEKLNENYVGPEWLLQRVGEHQGTADPDDPNSRPMRATRYDDPVFIAEASEAIDKLFEFYRDDERNFVIQVGILGFWGEWHTFPRLDWSPTKFTKHAILDAYMKNLGPDSLTQVRYPNEPLNVPQARMGYTNGSATLTDHGYEFGDAVMKGQLWKQGPIGGEWPPNVEQKHWKRFFQTEEGEFFINQARYSTMMVPEHKEIVQQLPGWTEGGLFMHMHRRMGYNFQVKAVNHLATLGNTGQTLIEIDLHNAGIAPFYKDWEVQLAIINAETSGVVDLIEVDTDLRALGPKETTRLAAHSNAKLNPASSYQIGLRILQPGADQEKSAAWKLNARNAYVVLANDIQVVRGRWNEAHALEGGWNILDNIQQRAPIQNQPLAGKFFPFQGSFRPTK